MQDEASLFCSWKNNLLSSLVVANELPSPPSYLRDHRVLDIVHRVFIYAILDIQSYLNLVSAKAAVYDMSPSNAINAPDVHQTPLPN